MQPIRALASRVYGLLRLNRAYGCKIWYSANEFVIAFVLCDLIQLALP